MNENEQVNSTIEGTNQVNPNPPQENFGKKKKGKALWIIPVILIIVIIILFNIVANNDKNNNINNQTTGNMEMLENNNSTNKETEENQKDDEYEFQRKKMQDKIDEIDASTINGNIPTDLVLKINGEDLSYDYNWSYAGFKEEYNQQNIFTEGQSNYYLLYSDDDLKYKIDFKLFPSVDNSVSNVGLGVSNIECSKKSDNVNKNWNIAGIYLQDDLTTVLNILGNYDSAEIREIEGESVEGITCSWTKVWFGDKYANIAIKFDTNFEVESINIGTIIYNTQKIDKYKSESKHVSQ